jgi:hypothetical protein
MMRRGKVGKFVGVFGRDRVVGCFGFVMFGLLGYGRRRGGWCFGYGDFGRVMVWVRSDVRSKVDGPFVGGGMGDVLGFGVG